MISESHRSILLQMGSRDRPVVLRTYSLLSPVQSYLDEAIGVFLDGIGARVFYDQLTFCVRELAVNAKKANTKRVYFDLRRVDPADPEAYARGMRTFKQDILADQTRFTGLLRDRGLYVKVEFLKHGGRYSIAVRNNTRALPVEVARVREKLQKAREYKSVQDALTDVIDESEGAGLGILFLVLMLEKVGFTGEFFRFYTVGGETVARIFLPEESTWPSSGRKTSPLTP